MYLTPMKLQAPSIPFHVTRRGTEPMLGVEHDANCKEFPVWLAWGEPGGSFYTAQAVHLCLN